MSLEDPTTERRPRWPRWVALAAVALTTVVAVVFGARFGTDPSVVGSPLIGRDAPDVTLSHLERDGELALRELSGDVVVVNFWASWCPPCRAEHPALVRSAERYADDGVTFLGVVYQDREAAAIEFLDELGRGYDHVVDPDGRAGVEFGVFGLPETFFIDRDGTIAAKITGQLNQRMLEETIDEILAGEEPGARSGGEQWDSPGG